MSSCALFQPVTKADDKDKEEEELDPISGRRVYDPETGTYIEVKDVVLQDMDTVIWTEVPASAFPPITASDETFIGNLDSWVNFFYYGGWGLFSIATFLTVYSGSFYMIKYWNLFFGVEDKTEG
ncbi:MAG: hypothetical protein F6K19_35145 [Cyanothece sp. SIO1E1]|nr:hypothetical protein [Cyanothece sp. SIO1E1]